MRSLCAVAAAGAILCGHAIGAQKWRIQYFYDEEHATLVINDLAFPSAARGVAVGYIDKKGNSKAVSVTSSDRGAHWAVAGLHEIPVSLFFLNETLGWMVTPKGIWETRDAGKAWEKLKKSPEGLIRVHFLDEQRGFAVGTHKSAYETADGGKTWQSIAAAEEVKTTAEYTSYNCIVFANGKDGMITGYSSPPRHDGGKPHWLEPELATRRKEWPHISITLDTRDGGKTWSSQTASLFGHIARVSMLPNGMGLGLLAFSDAFEWPSDVLWLDGKTGKSSSVYREKDREISDVLLLHSGGAYLAGVEVVGRLQHSPIPQALKILHSEDLHDWKEMEVDYKANAGRAMLRAAPDGSLWVATDTGMILKLEPPINTDGHR